MRRTLDPVTLRLFVTVCEERNIARAAAREAIVASAVSKRIAALELTVGTALLVRGRRGIVPTAAGEALLRRSHELLGSMERLHAELSEFAGGAHGSVRVVASLSVLAEQLPDDIASFLARYQAVRVSLDERVSPEVVRSVREGAADLGVLWDAIDLGGLHSVPYRFDHLCVVMHPSHRLARRKRLRFVDTFGETTIGVAPGGTMDAMLRRQAALLGHTLAYRIQVSSLDAACRIVGAGLGVAVLPGEATAPHVSASGLAMLPLAEPWAVRRFVICSRGDSALSATARLLIDHLRALAKHGAPPPRSPG
ncbi:MAG TPA: LysR substrate-binding domain-containing protein [Burkholderiaceae bacterium]|nr:LysR substrate-binding domain-containing protein [Burkholderiaceae bacterium]